ncbi:hypothetical protein [Azotobacter salinestris]|uniref:hypothetical protein n=1 Tax=Azotobacter salinestris TaxID=69964 RepID=UPI0032DEF51A
MTTYNTGNSLPSADPKDLYDNAQALDEAINGTAAAFTDRLGTERTTLFRAVELGMASVGVYPDHASGVAAVGEGGYFCVPAALDTEWLVLYRVESGAYVEKKRLPSKVRIDEIQDRVDTAEDNITALDERLDTAESDINIVEGRATALEGRATALEGRTTTSEADIDYLSAASVRQYPTLAAMTADLTPADGIQGVVTDDPDEANNGWHEKSGASGTGGWARLADQPVRESSSRLLKDGFGEDVLFSITDSDGRRTWLEAEGKNGGPTEFSKSKLKESLAEEAFGEDVLVSITDSEKRRTWLEAKKSNGYPTEYSASLIRKSIGVDTHDRSGYLVAFVDSENRLTDLVVRESDGKFPDFVIEGIAARIQQFLPGGNLFAADKYLSGDGVLLDFMPSATKWSAWGSSTIDEWNVELSEVAAYFGAGYYNGGNGATRIEHQFAQMGITNALLLPSGGEIPASGSVSASSSNVVPVAAFKETEGTLSGVHGYLTSDGSSFIFTRSSPGGSVSVAEYTQFIPAEGPKHRSDFVIFNFGKNDINDGSSIESIIANQKLAMEWLTPLVKRLAIVTHFGQTGRVSGDDYMQRIDAVNNFFKSTYGDNVFDLQGYLCGAQVWVDTGLTPTPEDLANQENGCIAPQLSRDIAHMNSVARLAAANKLKQFIFDKGWFS